MPEYANFKAAYQLIRNFVAVPFKQVLNSKYEIYDPSYTHFSPGPRLWHA